MNSPFENQDAYFLAHWSNSGQLHVLLDKLAKLQYHDDGMKGYFCPKHHSHFLFLYSSKKLTNGNYDNILEKVLILRFCKYAVYLLAEQFLCYSNNHDIS